jgi:hypothetical protein
MEAGLALRNHAPASEKAAGRLTLRFIRAGKRCGQSQQFRLSLTNSDSASLTIVLRQSHNGAPKIPEFVPVS